ncbi:MAG: hypothetical protein J6S43_06325 [Lentisphaeria bacterium]|nr:hypothetical protein [Lentisphaeria bacterium]
MDFKKIIDTYISIVKTKYICFEGTATQQELLYYIAVWVAGAIALAIVSVILGLIGLGFIGAILCTVWNLANLLPGIGTLVRFLNSRKAE